MITVPSGAWHLEFCDYVLVLGIFRILFVWQGRDPAAHVPGEAG
jgi:hypothetical protein